MDARRQDAVSLARSGRQDLIAQDLIERNVRCIMLEDNLKTQLKGYLERLVQPVEIIASLDDGDKSREMLELLQDIVSLSPLVSLASARDATQVKPSFALRRPGQEPQVRFAGLPMGHEFTSLVLALLQAGGHTSEPAPPVVEQLRTLRGEV